DSLVNSFGIFPEEDSSGVDKQGRPRPSGAMIMSRKGNDRARAYLGNAARAAIGCNPAVRALDRRLRANGARGDVATGHCMRKLVHLVFAVGKTNRPFDPGHYPWEPADAQGTTTTPGPRSRRPNPVPRPRRRRRLDPAAAPRRKTPWATSGTS